MSRTHDKLNTSLHQNTTDSVKGGVVRRTRRAGRTDTRTVVGFGNRTTKRYLSNLNDEGSIHGTRLDPNLGVKHFTQANVYIPVSLFVGYSKSPVNQFHSKLTRSMKV